MENEKAILPEVQQIADAINAAVKNAGVTVSINPSPAEQHSLLLFPTKARECAQWLKAESPWQLDYLSNVSGNDWPEDAITKQTPKQPVKDAGEEPMHPCLEAVYHLYSIRQSLGPIIIRMRTENRSDKVELPSLTPIWRSAELQEREIFDLYGIHFEGHPDLRRLLMWDEFEDHPMRRDYVEPDDYDYEPT
ncbi:MAG: NADH-quinone oxidoreductase subunit C, partial [Verrucomicrobia bacterium]|nr:NADH-quinone oxidoreductase subunit C [Verrucomicrobiota bacterium]